MRFDGVEDQADDQNHAGNGRDTKAQRIDGEHGAVRLPALAQGITERCTLLEFRGLSFIGHKSIPPQDSLLLFNHES